MSPPQLVLGVSPVYGSVFLYPGYRPARGFWPELLLSFRKISSRPARRAIHRTAEHVAIQEHAACQLASDAKHAELCRTCTGDRPQSVRQSCGPAVGVW